MAAGSKIIRKILTPDAVRRRLQARGKDFTPKGNKQKGTTKTPSSEAEGARLDPETGGSVNVSREIERRRRSGAEKVTKGKVSGDRGIVAESTSKNEVARGKRKAELSGLIREGKATTKQKRQLKKMYKKDELDEFRARSKASETRRTNAAKERAKDKRDPRDTFIQTGEIMKGYEPTDREMQQAISNLTARKTDPKIRERLAIIEKKATGAKTIGRGKGGPIPKPKPTTPSEGAAINRGNRMSEMEAGAAKAMKRKYMKGGQIGCGAAMRGYGKGPYKKK